MRDAPAVPWFGASDEPFSRAIAEAARSARIAVVVTRFDGVEPRVVFASQSFADMIGYTVEELQARSPLANMPPEEVDRVRARLAKRHAGEHGTTTYEVDMIRKDGGRISVEATTTDVEMDGHTAMISFLVDVTQRKQAESALARTEASFRRLIELAPEAFGILRDGRFVYVNQAYVDMLGYGSAEELMAKSIEELVHPDDVPQQRARAKQVLSGERMPPLVYRAIRKDGSMLLVEVSTVMFEFEGKPSILGIGRDVTERKRLEAQLVQADRLAALGTLAAGVAHEVNNPLAYLLLNLEWIARQLPTAAQDPSRMTELVAMMEEARHGAERVGAIVRELRAFSRADGETRRHVDLKTAVLSAIKIAAHEIKHRARVTTAFEDVPPVWANEARLEQVLLNLLLNAAQAMSEATPESNEIRIEVRAGTGENAIIEVSDNGSGIPPETQRRIFDPFFTTKPVGVGTGLGLSICHSIIASLGGQITVQSRVGEGTTFRIVLPTHGGEVGAGNAATEPPVTDARPSPRARILVIDDELSIANTLRDLLQSDHEVTALTTGRAALELLLAGADFDVIFCDLMMPHVSGIDVYEQLAARKTGLEQRIVFMTGGAFTTRAAEFLARVANKRVEKPFALTAIEEIVRDAVRARREQPRAEGRVA